MEIESRRVMKNRELEAAVAIAYYGWRYSDVPLDLDEATMAAYRDYPYLCLIPPDGDGFNHPCRGEFPAFVENIEAFNNLVSSIMAYPVNMDVARNSPDSWVCKIALGGDTCRGYGNTIHEAVCNAALIYHDTLR